MPVIDVGHYALWKIYFKCCLKGIAVCGVLTDTPHTFSPTSFSHCSPYVSCKTIMGRGSVKGTDSGMTILLKKNAGLFSHNAVIHPNTNPAFHRAVARRSNRLSIIKAE